MSAGGPSFALRPFFLNGAGPAAAWRKPEAAGYALVALSIFFSCFTFLRPSPYEFFAVPAMALWFVLGLRLHRAALLFVALLGVYQLALLVALLPYLAESVPVMWTAQSVYLTATAVFFVMFFSGDTAIRTELALRAYLASCLFAAGAGILAFYQDNGILFTLEGRAAGVFEDPNVLGSFLVLGALFLLRPLLTGSARQPLLLIAGLGILLAAVFLTFSRGSWLALVGGTAITVLLTFRTSPPAVRRRIAVATLVVVAVAVAAMAALLTDDRVADQFSSRAQLTQSYDEGVTGRFGNQLRSIPMLLERPGGFGPLRYRLIFDLEPHNSYLGGFANGGWVGGFAFTGLVLATIVVGWRLATVPSPFRDHAQVVVPALLMFFVQAVQIDIDHWRHVYMLFGMVWGLECARVRWAEGGRPSPAVPVPFPSPALAAPMVRVALRESAFLSATAPRPIGDHP